MRGGLPRPCPSRPLSSCRRARQCDKAVQLREQQRADMQLRFEAAGANEARDLRRGNELRAYPGLRLEGCHARSRLDEERMNSVVETPRAGRGFTQVVNGARGQSGLLQELAARAIGWFLAALDQARRQLPRECFQRWPILPHDRNFPAPGERDNGDIVGLLDGVIEL